MEPLRFEYTLTFEEYAEPFRPLLQKGVVRGRIIFMILFALSVLLAMSTLVNRIYLMTVIWSTSALWSAWQLTRVARSHEQRLRPVWQQSSISKTPIRVEFSGDGVQWVSDSGLTSKKWSAFTEWNDTPLAIHLYEDPVTPYVIPKRVMPANALDEIRSACTKFITRSKSDDVRGFEVLPTQ